MASTMVSPRSVGQKPAPEITGSGDTVMAELQNKLKGRGRIEPINGSRKLKTKGDALQNGNSEGSPEKSPTKTNGSSTIGVVKRMKLNLEGTCTNVSPPSQDNKYKPIKVVKVDVADTKSTTPTSPQKTATLAPLKKPTTPTPSTKQTTPTSSKTNDSVANAKTCDDTKETPAISISTCVDSSDELNSQSTSCNSSLLDHIQSSNTPTRVGGVKVLARAFSARSKEGGMKSRSSGKPQHKVEPANESAVAMDTVVEEDHVNNETTDSACGRANNTTILNDTLNDEEDTKMEEKLMGEASDSSNDSGSVGSSETVTMSGDKEETVTTEEKSDTQTDTQTDSDYVYQRYQNIFDDEWYMPVRHNNVAAPPKKPMPTPRKTDQPTYEPVGVPRLASPSKSESEDEEGYQLMASMIMPTNASTKQQEPTSTTSDNTVSRNDTIVLQKLNSEIDLLKNVLDLPSLTDEAEVPQTEHGRVAVTKSHNRNEGSGVIRRNTSKGLKDLRKGVVSVSQEEEYITMSPTSSLLLSWSPGATPHSNNVEPLRKSNYYLEILPDDNTQTGKDSQTSPTQPQKPIQLSPTQPHKPKSHPTQKYKAPLPPNNGPQPSTTTLQFKAPPPPPEPIPDNQYMDMQHPHTKPKEPKIEIKSPVQIRARRKDQQQQGKGSGWKRSQGSIFAQEMINLMSEKSTTYTPVPVFHNKHSNSCELKSNVSPPPIPVRPPQTYIQEADSSDEEPTDYIYAPVHPPDSIANRMKMDSKNSTLTPPGLPPKSKSLLREQGLCTPPQSPTPYLKPIKSKSEKKNFVVGSSSPTDAMQNSEKSSKSGLRAKDVIRALRKQTVDTDSTHKPKKKSSPEISAPRIPMALPAKRWDGLPEKTDLSSDDDSACNEFSSLDKLTLERSYSTPNLLDGYTTMRGHNVAASTHSATSLEVKSVSDTPSPVATSLTSGIAATADLTSSDITSPIPASSLTCDDINFQWKRKGVQRRKNGRCDQIKKINRNSLALILQNHDLISKQLEEYSQNSGSHRNSIDSKELEDEVDQTPPKRGRETLLRSLGEILLEINDVLRETDANEEDDIITAIEKQFKFKLRKLPFHDKAMASVPPWNDQEREVEVELTDHDVQVVVDYVHTNCSGCSKQEVEQVEESFSKPKEISRFAPLRRSVSDAALLQCPKDLYEIPSPTSLSPPSFTQSIATAELKLSNFKKNKRRLTATASDLIMTTSSSNSGVGYFTHKGGTLSNTNTSVIVELPEGAVPKGRRQKIMIEVLQTVCTGCNSNQEDIYQSLTTLTTSGSTGNVSDVKNMVQKKKGGSVQLSPTVMVGPSDAMLSKPIKIYIPHCVPSPSDNPAWNLKVVGRPQNHTSGDWIPIQQSSGRFIPKYSKQKDFRSTTFKLHKSYVKVKTKQLGCFRLIGQSVAGSSPTKNMVCSIYTEKHPDMLEEHEHLKVKVFFVNAILDSVEALEQAAMSEGYTCLERNIPITCTGNNSDMVLTLTMDTNQGKTILDSQVIPFGVFWRVTCIGQAQVTLSLSPAQLATSKIYMLHIQQVNDHQPQEVEFMLP